MDIKTNGARNSSAIHIDKNIITQFENIFQGREDRVGILKGRKPDGKKNQWMEDKPFDAEMHLNSQLLQGLEPTNENGECKFAFVDVDQEVDTVSFYEVESTLRNILKQWSDVSEVVPIADIFKGGKLIIETPNQKNIEELCKHNNFHPSQIVKVLAYIATCDDNKKYPVLVSIRGDQEINDIKLSNKISQELKQNVLDIRIISNEEKT